MLAATSSAQEKGVNTKRPSFTVYFGSYSSGNTCSKSDTLLRVESSFGKDVLYQVYSVEMRLDDTFFQMFGSVISQEMSNKIKTLKSGDTIDFLLTAKAPNKPAIRLASKFVIE